MLDYNTGQGHISGIPQTPLKILVTCEQHQREDLAEVFHSVFI